MEEIAIIGDEDTVLGFKLVGIRKSAIFNKDKIKQDLEKFGSVKILILTEEVAQFLRDKNLMADIQPVIAEVPDKNGAKGFAQQEISRLYESAIGVALK
jgi:V/A-type H+/Na+-transporting ATPase subunit F